MSKKGFSVDHILTASTHRLMLFGAGAIVIAFLSQFYVLSYQSHRAACEIVSARLNQFIGPLSRELAVGEMSVASSVFDDFKKVIEIPGANPSLEMRLSTHADENVRVPEICKASMFGADVFAPISFAGQTVAVIEGRITYFPTLPLIGFAMLVVFGLMWGVRLWAMRLLRQIQNLVIEPIKGLSSGEPLKESEKLPFEVQDVGRNIDGLKAKLVEDEKLSSELAREKQMSELAVQVAHDIRSPLSVLAMMEREDFQFDTKTKALMATAAKRIQDISQSLTKKYRKEKLNSAPERSEKALAIVVLESILSEKHSLAIERGVRLSSIVESAARCVFVDVDSVELGRVISNLIDNAIEAFEDYKTEIREIFVNAHLESEMLIISVRDTGPGIDSAVLPTLGQKGVTLKNSGNGLGLFHAKNVCELAKGNFLITSEVKRGTSVVLKLPLKGKLAFVLIDDDTLIRDAWNLSAERDGIEILTFESVEAFLKANLPKETLIFLDEDLGNEIRGTKKAPDLWNYGYRKIHLTTAHAEITELPPEITAVHGKRFPARQTYNEMN